MKGPYYNMKIMYKYGGMTMNNSQKDSKKTYKDNNGAMNMISFK